MYNMVSKETRCSSMQETVPKGRYPGHSDSSSTLDGRLPGSELMFAHICCRGPRGRVDELGVESRLTESNFDEIQLKSSEITHEYTPEFVH
jgi:hypothetical protein